MSKIFSWKAFLRKISGARQNPKKIILKNNKIQNFFQEKNLERQNSGEEILFQILDFMKSFTFITWNILEGFGGIY